MRNNTNTIDDYIQLLSNQHNLSLVSINEAELSTEDLAERILLGPQEEVARKLVDFNRHWGTDLGVTRTFRWKAGYMNEIKKLYKKWVLKWDMRNNGVHSFFRRIENQRWAASRFKQKLEEINSNMLVLRQNSAIWQDNTDAVTVVMEEILNKTDVFRESSTNNIEFKVFIDKTTPNYKIATVIKMSDIKMDIYNGGRLEDNRIATIPFINDIYILIRWNLCQYLNNALAVGLNNISCRIEGSTVGLMPGNTYGLYFPYISRHQMSQPGNPGAAVCWGDMLSNIETALRKFDGEAALHFIKEWYSSYQMGHTQPYNNLNTTFYGRPKFLNHEQVTLLGSSNAWEECRIIAWENDDEENDDVATPYLMYYDSCDEDESYCDKVECQLRNICGAYLLAVKKVPYDPWQDEPSTEQSDVPINILRSAIPLPATEWEAGEDGIMRRIQQ